MLTGILAPMPEEIELILENMEVKSVYESGKRKFYKGRLNEKECVAALSRIGKVASSVTAAVMIEHFKIDRLIVAGVAGSLKSHLKLGDIVVASESIQHDLDARPLFPQFEAPLLEKGFFVCEQSLVNNSILGCEDFLKEDFRRDIHQEDIRTFGLHQPRVYTGQICCGDQFIRLKSQLQKIHEELPDALCVEMECGAVGQICYEYNIPYVVVRTISDSADEEAHVDFSQYIERVAKHYTLGIIKKILARLD
ncbi:MAG: 5'-methylthioadenosine/adenosylhomocysteine nucleosidase [Cytophagaceae bacterium]